MYILIYIQYKFHKCTVLFSRAIMVKKPRIKLLFKNLVWVSFILNIFCCCNMKIQNGAFLSSM